MMHYMFWGTLMPPRARKTMDDLVDEIHQMVSKAAQAGEPLDFPWLYVEPKTVKAMVPILTWWTGPGKTVRDCSRWTREAH